MSPGYRIQIEKVENGFIVRPALDFSRDGPTPIEDVFVFQDLGMATATRDNQPAEETALGFIEKHFK